MAGYVRVDTSNNISDGNVIAAADLDNEFDGIQAAFNASTGHNHDGTTGEGAPILVLGPTQDVVVGASTVTPKTTNTVDIGSSSLKFKDLFLAGNASIGGTLGVTGATTLSAALTYGGVTLSNAVTGTGNMVLSASPTLTGTIAAEALTTSGTVTVNGGTANAVAFLNGSKVLTTGSALTFDGSNFIVNPTNTQFYVGSSFAKIENKAGASASLVMADTTDSGTIKNIGSSIAFVNSVTEGMRLTSTGLGIGTSSPREKLDVAGNIAAPFQDNQTIQFQYLTGSSYGLGMMADANGRGLKLFTRSADGTGYISFSTGGMTEKMRLDYSGNLGLGVTPSAWVSSWKSVDVTSGGASLYGSLAIGGVGVNAYFDSGAVWRYKTSYAAGRYEIGSTGVHSWYTAPSGTAGNAISFTQAMTLDASGNLGVGTSSPTRKLDVVGNGYFSTGMTVADTSAVNWGAWTSIQENGFFDAGGNFLHNAVKTSGVNDTWNYRNNGFATRYKQLNAVHSWYFAASGTAGNAISWTQAMTLDASGNLGVGTSSPAYKLVVSNGGASGIEFGPAFSGTANLIQSYNRSGGAYVNTVYDANEHIFNTLGTQRLRLDASGNLGLGVTPSAWWSSSKAIQVGSNGAPYFSVSQQTATTCDGYVMWGARLVGDRSFVYQTSSDPVAAYRQNGATHAWFNAPSGTAGNAISFTQAMTLDASGNLGVGTTSPSTRISLGGGIGQKLSVYDQSSIRSGFGVDMGGSSYELSIFSGYNEGHGVITFGGLNTATNTYTERARIDSSGNLLVGTTSFSVSPSQGFVVQNTSGASISVGHANGTPTGFLYANFVYNSTQIGSITQGGTTAVSYNTTSDYRLKTVLGPVSDAGSRIDALEPVEYEWKVDGSRTRGFLAHKFQEVYAGSVTGSKDAVDEKGKPVYQAMQASSSEVIADLVAEIQSLRQRLAAAGI